MQQGLRPLVQDENSLAALHRLPSAKTLGGGGSGGGGGSAGSGKGAAALPGLRKALGNITNNTSRGADSENAAPPLGKTPARRAPLGDITNNSTAQKGQQQQAHKAPLPSKPTALATQQQQQQATCRADAYAAEGGVERQAGWGWEQLERDRLQREDAESTQRLASLASLPSHGLPSFFPLWVSEQDADRSRHTASGAPSGRQLASRPVAWRSAHCLSTHSLVAPVAACARRAPQSSRHKPQQGCRCPWRRCRRCPPPRRCATAAAAAQLTALLRR